MIHKCNFKHLPKEIQEDLKLIENRKYPQYIYVGRANKKYGLPECYLANHFKPSRDVSIHKCLENYKKSFDVHFLNYRKSQAEFERLYEEGSIVRDGFWFNFRLTYPPSARIMWALDCLKWWENKLSDIYLVCWCCKEMDDDTPCHGDIIKKILEETK